MNVWRIIFICMIWRGNAAAAPSDAFNNTRLSNCNCGKKNELSRIIGGSYIYPWNKYPWHVVIKKRYKYVCSGALISKHHVLTTASCFFDVFGLKMKQTDLNVGIGVSELFQDENAEYYQVNRVIIHDDFIPYSPYNLENNVAIVEIQENTINENFNNINAICLPSLDSSLFTDPRGIITGWGKNGWFGAQLLDLQEVHVTILSNCQSELENSSSFFCIAQNPYKNICKTDEGDPLVVEKDGRFFLKGIAIYDQACHPSNFGQHSKFTNILHFVSWVKEMLGDDFPCLALDK